MKFSCKRSKKSKEAKEANKLLRKIYSLNQSLNCSFELNKDKSDIIYSNLDKEDLPRLHLPANAFFTSNYKQTACNGFVNFIYNESTIFTIYAKDSGLK